MPGMRLRRNEDARDAAVASAVGGAHYGGLRLPNWIRRAGHGYLLNPLHHPHAPFRHGGQASPHLEPERKIAAFGRVVDGSAKKIGRGKGDVLFAGSVLNGKSCERGLQGVKAGAEAVALALANSVAAETEVAPSFTLFEF